MMDDTVDRNSEPRVSEGHEGMPETCYHRGCEEPAEVWVFGRGPQRYVCMDHIGNIEYEDWSSQRVRFVTHIRDREGFIRG